MVSGFPRDQKLPFEENLREFLPDVKMVYLYFIGPFKDERLGQLAEDFVRRLDRLWPVKKNLVPEKPAEILKVLGSKSKKGFLVSLDAHGEGMDSHAFTRWVTQASQDIHFFAWGADGPPREKSLPKMKSLSLSPMTYSHELARVLLLEQLYRAGATLKGHPYPR